MQPDTKRPHIVSLEHIVVHLRNECCVGCHRNCDERKSHCCYSWIFNFPPPPLLLLHTFSIFAGTPKISTHFKPLSTRGCNIPSSLFTPYLWMGTHRSETSKHIRGMFEVTMKTILKGFIQNKELCSHVHRRKLSNFKQLCTVQSVRLVS